MSFAEYQNAEHLYADLLRIIKLYVIILTIMLNVTYAWHYA